MAIHFVELRPEQSCEKSLCRSGFTTEALEVTLY